LIVDAVIVAGRSCGLLMALLAPLLAALGELPDILDVDIGLPRRCLGPGEVGLPHWRRRTG
jgi:hypothetical protein